MYGGRRGAAAAMAIGLVLIASGAQAEGVGACAWARAPKPDRDAFLAAYGKDIHTGLTMLKSADDRLLGIASVCAHRSDLPRMAVLGAVTGAAVQDSAARALSVSLKITRPALDAAWAQAPAAARDCATANAAEAFGEAGPACPDPRATFWFLLPLGIASATDHPNSAQALYYMNAKAQEGYAEGLIAAFLAKRMAAASPPSP